MRQKSFFISTILVTLIMGFNSCTLFIDDDELFNTNSEPLPKYQGKGYDEPVTGKGEYVDVTYQLYESTMTIQPEDELTNYIHRVDTMGYLTVIHIDKNVPKDLVPKIGQMIVSGNIDLFPHHGLCDMVYSIEESNGELLVKSALSEPQYAFKEMQIHTHIPTKGLFEEYEVFDEDGKSLGVINHEEQAKIRANRVKDINSAARRFQDKDYDINFNDWVSLLKTIVEGIKGGCKDTVYKGKPNRLDWEMFGGINFPETTIDANLNPFSDDPMFLNVNLGRGEFELEAKFSVNFGMPEPKYYDILPKSLEKKLNTPKAFMIGAFPVVIIPNIFAQLGFQAKASISLSPWISVPWGDEKLKLLEAATGTHQIRKTEAGLDIDGEGELDAYFLVNLGLGLYTDAVTFNLQPQIRWSHVLKVGTGDLISTKDQKTSSGLTYKQAVDVGAGFKIVSDGGTFASLIDLIKRKAAKFINFVDKASEFANKYYESGTFSEWQEFLCGAGGQNINDPTHPEIDKSKQDILRAEYQKRINEGKSPDQVKDEILKEKAETKKKVDAEMDVRNQKNIHKIDKKRLKENKSRNKKFEMEFGPWYPSFLNLYTYKRYWYPKIKDKSLHVGASSEGGKFKMAASYQMEDHGLKPLKGIPEVALWWVPGFEIKSGSTMIDDITAGRGNGTFNITLINDDTPNDQRVTCTFNNLNYPEGTLTCVPYFALWREAFAYGGEFVDRVYDEPITFSVTTPSMAITKIQLTQKPTRTVDENHKETYHAKFNVIVKIRGTSNIADWGIRENNSDSKNKYKSSSLASPVTEGDERSGEVSYVMEYSISSENLVANVSLTPYCFLTGQNTSDPKKAKYFADFINEFDFGEWFTSSTGDDNYSHTNNYTLTLESVKCISTDDELSEEEDDYDYDEEE